MSTTQERVNELGPWHYCYEFPDGIITPGKKKYSKAQQFWKRVNIEAVTAVFGEDLSNLRAVVLGCIEGHEVKVLADLGFGEVVGVDLSPEALKRAAFALHDQFGLTNVRLEQGDVCDPDLPQRLGKFDLVCNYGILYRLESPVLGIRHTYQMAKDIVFLKQHFPMREGLMQMGSELALVKFPNIDNHGRKVGLGGALLHGVQIVLAPRPFYHLLQLV